MDGAFDSHDWRCARCGHEVDGAYPGDAGCPGDRVSVTHADPREALPSVEIDGEPHCRFYVETDCGGGQAGVWERKDATLPDLAALVAALPDEQAQAVVVELCKHAPARLGEMVDDAMDAEADKILEMSDEEFDAEIREGGGDPERLKKWGAATGRWIKSCADYSQKAREAEEKLSAAEAALAEERSRLSAAIDLIKEYEAQWGDDYLAKKWKLKEERERIEKPAAPRASESGKCQECGGEGRVPVGDMDDVPCPKCRDAEGR